MGRRFKTQAYKKYEADLLEILPELSIPKGPLEVVYIFGVSNSVSDWDNPIKPFQDVLQKRYDFNDSAIYKATVHKIKVAKGAEFIKFEILPYAFTGELMTKGIDEIDTNPTATRITEEVSALAKEFADAYEAGGVMAAKSLPLLTEMLKYDKGIVVRAVQQEMANRGYNHFKELVNALPSSNT